MTIWTYWAIALSMIFLFLGISGIPKLAKIFFFFAALMDNFYLVLYAGINNDFFRLINRSYLCQQLKIL